MTTTGRPRLEETRGRVLCIRFTAGEIDVLQRAAGERFLGAFIRERALAGLYDGKAGTVTRASGVTGNMAAGVTGVPPADAGSSPAGPGDRREGTEAHRPIISRATAEKLGEFLPDNAIIPGDMENLKTGEAEAMHSEPGWGASSGQPGIGEEEVEQEVERWWLDPKKERLNTEGDYELPLWKDRKGGYRDSDGRVLPGAVAKAIEKLVAAGKMAWMPEG